MYLRKKISFSQNDKISQKDKFTHKDKFTQKDIHVFTQKDARKIHLSYCIQVTTDQVKGSNVIFKS